MSKTAPPGPTAPMVNLNEMPPGAAEAMAVFAEAQKLLASHPFYTMHGPRTAHYTYRSV